MKMKKFLAVVLLVAMCSSFMAVSASASGNGFDINDFTNDATVVPSEPEVTPSEQEDVSSEPDVNVGEDANVNVSDEPVITEPAENNGDKTPVAKDETKDNKLKESTVAVIGKNQYDSLAAAIKASVKGDTITFVKNIEVSSVIFKTSNMTIDLNGHTLTFVVGKGEENQDGSYTGHPYCMLVQKNTKIVNGTVAIVADADVEGAFLQQNPIVVDKNVTLNFLADIEYDVENFAGTQFEKFGGEGTVIDGSKKDEETPEEEPAESDENTTSAEEPNANAEEPNANADEPNANSEEPNANSEEPNANAGEPNAETTEPTTEDVLLGAANGEKDFPIQLNDGQKFANFKYAFHNAKDGDTLKLLRDAGNDSDNIEAPKNKKLTIDLGGFKLSNPGINVPDGADLTIVNGTVKDINVEGNVTLGEGAVADDIKVTGKGMLNVNVANASANSVKADGAMNITAGTFTVKPEDAVLGENYIATENEEGKWVVSEKENKIAEVNGKEYATIKEAIDAAKDGETVTVKSDASENLVISGKNIVIDLGGNTLNGNITVESGAGLTVQNGTTNYSLISSGDVTLGANANIGTVTGTGLQLNGGTLTVNEATAQAKAITIKADTTVNISAGTFGEVNGGEFASKSVTGGKFGKIEKPENFIHPDYEKNVEGVVVEKFTLDPNPAKHIKDSNAGLTIKASQPIKSVKRATMEGNIDPKFYDLSKDKMTITFHADWLDEKLTVGEHEIVFTFENDEIKTLKLTVDTATEVKLDPASISYVQGEAKDTALTVNKPVTGKVVLGDKELTNKDYSLDEAKTTITLKAVFLNNCAPGSYELKVSTDYGVAVAGVTVQTAVVVDPASQQFEHQSTKDVTFTVTSTEEITSVSENDKELENTAYTVDGKKLVFKADFLNTLTAGKHEFVVRTANGSAKLTIEVVYSETSVTDASGKEISELKYFKGNSAMNNDFKFKTTPVIKTLSVGNQVLTEGTDYEVLPNGVISISKDAKFLSNLTAGKHALKFALANDATVDIKLLVYPTVKFSSTHYTKGSNTDIEITVSDMADAILYGSDLKPIEDKYWSYDSANGKYVISSKFFETLPEGDLTLGLRYGEMSFTLNGFKVNGNATIKPYNYVDKDGKSVWPYGSDTLGFKVSPDVKGVTIDGTELSDKQYSIDKNGILWIAASKLQKLEYGKHSIVVDTSYGEVEGEFYTKVGVEPKNEDYHVKGGNKNLSFVSSEPVKEVYVGREVLKSNYYSLSKDRMTITLNADFMNRLKADVTYTLTVTTAEGNAACNFRILSPESAASIPKTGDESNMLIWAAVMVLSGAAVVALIPRKKKN